MKEFLRRLLPGLRRKTLPEIMEDRPTDDQPDPDVRLTIPRSTDADSNGVKVLLETGSRGFRLKFLSRLLDLWWLAFRKEDEADAEFEHLSEEYAYFSGRDDAKDVTITVCLRADKQYLGIFYQVPQRFSRERPQGAPLCLELTGPPEAVMIYFMAFRKGRRWVEDQKAGWTVLMGGLIDR